MKDIHISIVGDDASPPSPPAQAALTLGVHRGLRGETVALLIAAVIALRATNVRVADIAPGADVDRPVPVPAAG